LRMEVLREVPGVTVGPLRPAIDRRRDDADAVDAIDRRRSTGLGGNYQRAGRGQQIATVHRVGYCHRLLRSFIGGRHTARAVAAQLLAAIEMNWSLPCGNPLSK